MSNRVRIPVHHQECILSARDYKMLGVIAWPTCRFKKIVVARFLLEILHAPRRPERLQFFLWKFFHRWFRVGSSFRETEQLSLFPERNFICRKVEPAFCLPLLLRAKWRNLSIVSF